MNDDIFQKLKTAAAKYLENAADPAHNMSHITRVYNLALTMAKSEKAVDLQVLQAATLLHDIGGPKEMSDPTGRTDHALVSAQMARPILKKLGFSSEKIRHIQDCIVSHRYKTENKPKTIEAKILFDADKLDSIGAIGIARAFCWIANNRAHIYKKVDIPKYVKENMGGKMNGRIQDKTKHSLQIEFEVKYKFLINRLFTKTAKKICRARMAYMKNFLNRLEKEVKGGL